MPYIVNFTDEQNKVPITVYDNTSNTDTSLLFPGRNVTGYGQIIAENFLHLLENFAKETAPANPVEGQLWYDTLNGGLNIFDSTNWKAASNIQKSPNEPDIEASKAGELWVDTTNQQLYVFSGTRWILVGPNFSTGLRSGPIVEQVIDSDNNARVILTFYVEDVPVFIISKDTFTPKSSIAGFLTIKSGLNVTDSTIDAFENDSIYQGRAASADSLNVAGNTIESTKFLRSDVLNTLEKALNIKNNVGLIMGADGNFTISVSATSANIYNGSVGSAIDLQTNQNGIPTTVLRVTGGNVGVNKLDPSETLDIDGNVLTSGIFKTTNTQESSNLNNGSITTAGGVSINKNLIIGTTLDVTGTTNLTTVQPKVNDTYELGTVTKRWNVVRTKTLVADQIQGVLEGNIVGNATTATNLRFVTNFRLQGDVNSSDVEFDGTKGGQTKIFNTTLTSDIISSKDLPDPHISTKEDTVLVFRPGSGLIKEKRDQFLADLGIPIGTILPYAGLNAPYGYLFCDGSEVERLKYPDLYEIIANTYGVPAVGFETFKLPDLRGRFPLGKDSMDNGLQVPNSGGIFVDAGGGNVDRVPGTEADNIGGNGGASSNSLNVTNLPDHEHNMQGSTGQQYYATRVDTAAPLDTNSFSGKGPTAVGQSQYIPSSGTVKVSTGVSLGQAFSVMNPYLTLNYIIRSGPPEF